MNSIKRVTGRPKPIRLGDFIASKSHAEFVPDAGVDEHGNLRCDALVYCVIDLEDSAMLLGEAMKSRDEIKGKIAVWRYDANAVQFIDEREFVHPVSMSAEVRL